MPTRSARLTETDMSNRSRAGLFTLTLVLALAGTAGTSLAQSSSPAPEWMRSKAQNPDDPRLREDLERALG